MARGQIGKHGRDHRPEGHDPSYTGVWHLYGSPGEPTLQGDWTQIVGYAPSGYRLLVGPTGQPKQAPEFMTNVYGGAPGSTVVTVPLVICQFANGRVPLSGHDQLGNYVAYYLDCNTGNIVAGV